MTVSTGARNCDPVQAITHPAEELHEVEERHPQLRRQELLREHRVDGRRHPGELPKDVRICVASTITITPRGAVCVRRREGERGRTRNTLPKPALTVFATSFTVFAPLITAMHDRYAGRSPREASAHQLPGPLSPRGIVPAVISPPAPFLPNSLTPSNAPREKRPRPLTEDLNGRNDELAGEQHADARGGTRPARERALEGVDERVREGRGHARAVEGHLERLAGDLRAREELHGQRGVLGDARRGRAGEVRGEDFLEELEEGCARMGGGSEAKGGG